MWSGFLGKLTTEAAELTAVADTLRSASESEAGDYQVAEKILILCETRVNWMGFGQGVLGNFLTGSHLSRNSRRPLDEAMRVLASDRTRTPSDAVRQAVAAHLQRKNEKCLVTELGLEKVALWFFRDLLHAVYRNYGRRHSPGVGRLLLSNLDENEAFSAAWIEILRDSPPRRMLCVDTRIVVTFDTLMEYSELYPDDKEKVAEVFPRKSGHDLGETRQFFVRMHVEWIKAKRQKLDVCLLRTLARKHGCAVLEPLLREYELKSLIWEDDNHILACALLANCGFRDRIEALMSADLPSIDSNDFLYFLRRIDQFDTLSERFLDKVLEKILLNRPPGHEAYADCFHRVAWRSKYSFKYLEGNFAEVEDGKITPLHLLLASVAVGHIQLPAAFEDYAESMFRPEKYFEGVETNAAAFNFLYENSKRSKQLLGETVADILPRYELGPLEPFAKLRLTPCDAKLNIWRKTINDVCEFFAPNSKIIGFVNATSARPAIYHALKAFSNTGHFLPQRLALLDQCIEYELISGSIVSQVVLDLAHTCLRRIH